MFAARFANCLFGRSTQGLCLNVKPFVCILGGVTQVSSNCPHCSNYLTLSVGCDGGESKGGLNWYAFDDSVVMLSFAVMGSKQAWHDV